MQMKRGYHNDTPFSHAKYISRILYSRRNGNHVSRHTVTGVLSAALRRKTGGTTLHPGRNLAVSPPRHRGVHLKEVPSLLSSGVTARIPRLTTDGRYPLPCSAHKHGSVRTFLLRIQKSASDYPLGH